jgi:hypothetical protein
MGFARARLAFAKVVYRAAIPSFGMVRAAATTKERPLLVCQAFISFGETLVCQDAGRAVIEQSEFLILAANTKSFYLVFVNQCSIVSSFKRLL